MWEVEYKKRFLKELSKLPEGVQAQAEKIVSSGSWRFYHPPTPTPSAVTNVLRGQAWHAGLLRQAEDKFLLPLEISWFLVHPARSCLLLIEALSVSNYTAVINWQHQRNRALAGGYSIFNPSALFAMRHAPFDKLMALSNVEGLCAKRLLDSLNPRTLIINH